MYKNRFTRANPGLLIYLVDQSYSMNDPWADGNSLAEQTALVINRCINETIQKFTDISVGVKESANVVIIGYGGIEKSESAYLIQKGTIKELADKPLRIETVNKKVPDGAGGLVEVKFDMPIWIEPKGVWGTPMASAFDMAYQIIDGWVTKKQNRQTSPDAKAGQPSMDPVPIVINVTDGVPTDDKQEVRDNANKIKNISCPDGNPLIFNVHLSPASGTEIQFPSQKPSGDEATELMYDLSSELPEAFVSDAKGAGFDVNGGEKTFISNCKTVEKFIAFLNFGTNVGTDSNNPG